MGEPEKKFRILFSGGGTAGSVAPLLAVAEELAPHPDPLPLLTSVGEGGRVPSPARHAAGEGQGEGGFDFLWLGTKTGPERQMVQGAGIKFKTIAAGKWRRYFSLKNFLDIFKIKIAFWQALWLMLGWRPNLVMSAGSFISVPVVWAAWLLRVPAMIHQQDVRPGLANKLMAPFAKAITVTFEKSLEDYGEKAVWTGNPIRKNFQFSIFNFQFKKFKIEKGLQVVLALGGGTGAEAINQLVGQGLGELTKFCQVIHVTGKDKGNMNHESRIMNYGKYEFLNAEEMAEALASADVVVSRAGMSALSELSYLDKPSIIIPLPDSHQEENAQMFKEAAVVLEQKDLTAGKLANQIRSLLDDGERRKELGEKIGKVMKRGAEGEVARMVLKLLKKVDLL